MRILFLTDLHGTREYLAPLVEREAGADLVLLGGDITNFAGASEAREIVEPLRRAFPRVVAVPGNVDLRAVQDYLGAEGLSLHGTGRGLDGVWVSGCGGSNITPLHSPTEFDEETLAALLEAGAPPAGEQGPWILVSHVPPSDTVCDRMFAGKHVGSPALRSFLDRRGPALCLCGHIHEGVGTDRIGATEVVNPGAFTSRRYAVVHVEGSEVRAELRHLEVDISLRIRAEAGAVASKIVGYAKHRLKNVFR
jgi:Icc-related predicted phosphoesterase